MAAPFDYESSGPNQNGYITKRKVQSRFLSFHFESLGSFSLPFPFTKASRHGESAMIVRARWARYVVKLVEHSE